MKPAIVIALVSALASASCDDDGPVDGDADGDTDGDVDGDADRDADSDQDQHPDQDGDQEGDGGLVVGAFFVAPDGDDGNPGSIEEPWLTIGYAAETLVAGDTVYIREGTYAEQVVLRESGVPDAPITLTAFPGEEPTVDGDDVAMADDWGGLVYIVEVSHIHLSGLRVINSGPSDTHAGIMVDRSSFVTVDHCSTHNTASSGIGVWRSSDVVIDSNDISLACNDGSQECLTVSASTRFQVSRNFVHDGGPGSQGGEGIDIKEECVDGEVFGNVVTRMNRLGIYVDAWEGYNHDVAIHGNVAYACEGFGFAVATENGGFLENIRIYNNVAYNNANGGFALGGWGVDGRTHAMARISFINNTAYRNGTRDGWGPGVWLDNPEAEEIVVRNNVLSDNGYAQLEVERAPASGLTVDHNLFDGPNGAELDAAAVVGDPLFRNPEAGDFHLGLGSPAIDAAESDGAPPHDFDGVARPVGEGVDIGAFERE